MYTPPPRGTDLSAADMEADADAPRVYQAWKGSNCRSDDKPRVWCDFCNKPRHTRETCRKIHGKHATGKIASKGRRIVEFLLQNEADSGPFNKEQMDQLLKLIKFNFSSRIASVSLAQSGSNPKALHMSKALSCLNSSSWIIDSGARPHA